MRSLEEVQQEVEENHRGQPEVCALVQSWVREGFDAGKQAALTGASVAPFVPPPHPRARCYCHVAEGNDQASQCVLHLGHSGDHVTAEGHGWWNPRSGGGRWRR